MENKMTLGLQCTPVLKMEQKQTFDFIKSCPHCKAKNYLSTFHKKAAELYGKGYRGFPEPLCVSCEKPLYPHKGQQYTTKLPFATAHYTVRQAEDKAGIFGKRLKRYTTLSLLSPTSPVHDTGSRVYKVKGGRTVTIKNDPKIYSKRNILEIRICEELKAVWKFKTPVICSIMDGLRRWSDKDVQNLYKGKGLLVVSKLQGERITVNYEPDSDKEVASKGMRTLLVFRFPL